MAAIRASRRFFSLPLIQLRSMSNGEYGSGAGRGGGGGGDIRSAGGSFGKMEAAHEEQYFRKLQALQIQAIKDKHEDILENHEREIRHHEEAIRRHKEAMDKQKKRLKELKEHEEDSD